MKRMILTVILLLCLYPGAAQASSGEQHWAQKEMDDLSAIYGIGFEGCLDNPADLSLQESLLKLAGIHLTPVQELKRYSVISSLVDALQIEDVNEVEVRYILSGFADACDY